jgi:RNA polymerase sigma-70 factor (ECF subfamily)
MRMDPPVTADSLLERARHGDRQALQCLIREEWPSAAGIIQAGVRNRTVAEDLTQEAFARVLAKLGSIEGGRERFRAYLHTVCRNLVRDQWRRRRPTEDDSALDGLPAPAADTESLALGNLDRELLVRALGQLSAEHRRVLELRFQCGLSTSEVARELGRRADAVRQLQRRALQRLRVVFEELELGDGARAPTGPGAGVGAVEGGGRRG